MMPPPDQRMKLPGEENNIEALKQAGVDPSLGQAQIELSTEEAELVREGNENAMEHEEAVKGRPHKSPQLLPEYTKIRALEMAHEGMSDNQIGKILGINGKTVNGLVEKLSGFEGVSKLVKSVGVMAARSASLFYMEIERRFAEDQASIRRIPTQSLVVAAAISVDKMNATLNKPAPGAVPQWEALEALPQDQAA